MAPWLGTATSIATGSLGAAIITIGHQIWIGRRASRKQEAEERGQADVDLVGKLTRRIEHLENDRDDRIRERDEQLDKLQRQVANLETARESGGKRITALEKQAEEREKVHQAAIARLNEEILRTRDRMLQWVEKVEKVVERVSDPLSAIAQISELLPLLRKIVNGAPTIEERPQVIGEKERKQGE